MQCADCMKRPVGGSRPKGSPRGARPRHRTLTHLPRRRPAPTRTVRLRVDLSLTRQEARKLEAKAASDLRSVADSVRRMLAEDLERKRPAQGGTKAAF